VALDAGLGWRSVLAVTGLVVVILALGWFSLSRPHPALHVEERSRDAWKDVLQSRSAWAVAGAYAVLSIAYYGLVAWLPLAYIERGWDVGSAATLLTIATASGLISTAVSPRLAASRYGQRGLGLVASVVAAVGYLGLAAAPDLGVVWAAAVGLATGTIFTITLGVPLQVARNPVEAGRVTSLMLLVGYLFAAAAPIALGGIRDSLGSFTGGFWVLALIAAAQAPLMWLAVPRGSRTRG
jgi:CP family cyanate transporter-like MFS transporter